MPEHTHGFTHVGPDTGYRWACPCGALKPEDRLPVRDLAYHREAARKAQEMVRQMEVEAGLRTAAPPQGADPWTKILDLADPPLPPKKRR